MGSSGSGVSSGSSGVAEEDLLGFGRLVGLGRGTHSRFPQVTVAVGGARVISGGGYEVVFVEEGLVEEDLVGFGRLVGLAPDNISRLPQLIVALGRPSENSSEGVGGLLGGSSGVSVGSGSYSVLVDFLVVLLFECEGFPG